MHWGFFGVSCVRACGKALPASFVPFTCTNHQESHLIRGTWRLTVGKLEPFDKSVVQVIVSAPRFHEQEPSFNGPPSRVSAYV